MVVRRDVQGNLPQTFLQKKRKVESGPFLPCIVDSGKEVAFGHERKRRGILDGVCGLISLFSSALSAVFCPCVKCA